MIPNVMLQPKLNLVAGFSAAYPQTALGERLLIHPSREALFGLSHIDQVQLTDACALGLSQVQSSF